MKRYTEMHRRQRGATLVIALIILIVLMILGVAAVTTANTQSKLAGNLQFEAEAKTRAENRTSDAEAWLVANNANITLTNGGKFSDPCGNRTQVEIYGQGCFAGYAAPNNDPMTMEWTNANSLADANNNRYVIELVALFRKPVGGSAAGSQTKSGTVNVYRITARGTNGRGAVRIVQSIYQVLNP